MRRYTHDPITGKPYPFPITEWEPGDPPDPLTERVTLFRPPQALLDRKAREAREAAAAKRPRIPAQTMVKYLLSRAALETLVRMKIHERAEAGEPMTEKEQADYRASQLRAFEAQWAKHLGIPSKPGG